MNASNKLCTELIPTYSGFCDIQSKEVTGYKLVLKKGENYYSIVSGMFRYRKKLVSENSYHCLYEKEMKHFNKDLVNKVAIFVNKDDAYNALIGCKHHGVDDLALIEIKLRKNLMKGIYSNMVVKDVPVFAGEMIQHVSELKEYPVDKNK